MTHAFRQVVLAALTTAATAAILSAMASAPPKGIVFDVGSLKSPLRDGLAALRAAGGRVCSVHPMFGPDTELLSGRHVIFVDLGVPEATELFALGVSGAGQLERGARYFDLDHPRGAGRHALPVAIGSRATVVCIELAGPRARRVRERIAG